MRDKFCYLSQQVLPIGIADWADRCLKRCLAHGAAIQNPKSQNQSDTLVTRQGLADPPGNSGNGGNTPKQTKPSDSGKKEENRGLLIRVVAMVLLNPPMKLGAMA